MVMGRDSHPRCPGFKSHHRIMDVHFFTNVVKIVMFFVKTKSTQKRPGLAHFLNKRKISPNLAMGKKFDALLCKFFIDDIIKQSCRQRCLDCCNADLVFQDINLSWKLFTWPVVGW